MARQITRVVILGAGFAGLFAAAEFEKLSHLAPGLEVTLIDRNNYHLFVPLLYHVGTGGIEPGNICFPIRATLKRGGAQPPVIFSEAEVVRIDTDNKTIVCDRMQVQYDYLVLAPGSTTNYYGIPGLEENIVPLKTIEDGIAMHNRMLESFEAALLENDEQRKRELLTFVVVGGGPTGVELSSTMALFIFRTLVRDYPLLVPMARVILAEAGDTLLRGMRPKIAQLALAELQKLGVEVILNCQVAKATPEGIETRDGRVIRSHNVSWVGGVKPVPLIQSLQAEKSRDGRVVVNEYLQVPSLPEIYVAGDCAYALRKDNGMPYPPTAQAAVREGAACAKNIVRAISKYPLCPFTYKWKGDMIFMGRNYGVGEFMGRVVSGMPAFLMYEGYHLLTLTGFKNKVVTVLDWAYDYFYSRSTVRLR